LANCGEKELFDFNIINNKLLGKKDKHNLISLLVMALAVYKYFKLNFIWLDKIYSNLSRNNNKEVSCLYDMIVKDKDFKIEKIILSGKRLKSMFANYRETREGLSNLLSLKEEFNIEYSLSQIFTPKQKELFLKKVRREKLTKTEREYFSRVVKKRVLALADAGLHHLAQEILR
jgi:hypothetical protein